ncbi:MAG: winged helix-turn-helix domain-containing protein [Burkholderiaceae bacterium]
MSQLLLTPQQARNLHLCAQGLLNPAKRKARRDDVLAGIRQMQLLQIDTIHVVNRSPYLVLFSRLGPYKPQWLEEHLATQNIFEVWAHEACFAPMEDYALHHAYNGERRHWGVNGAQRLYKTHKKHMAKLLDYVREHGPVKSSDFERTSGSGGWWGWSDEKKYLEAWFALGELMIARRENFHRVYDLTERVHPEAAKPARGTVDHAYAQMIERAIHALGITQAGWVNDYFRTKPKLKDRDLHALLDTGRVVQAKVAGWGAPAYVHVEHLPTTQDISAGKHKATHTTLLSPFDPVVWDRERALAMFDFDYRIECYTPEAKRKYGYFVLPILRRGQLVGRLDAKAHRTQGVFEVKALYLEDNVKVSDALAADLARAITVCAHWHETPQIKLVRCHPASLKKRMQF